MSASKPDPKLLQLASRKEAQLIGLLSALSEELAVQLAEALERDRLAGGKGLPFDSIMSGLRPKLRQTDPTLRRRVPTPQRAFFEVIEGLISNDRGEDKQQGRIARRSLDPIWRWLIENHRSAIEPLLPPITKALLKDERSALRAALKPFDEAANKAIQEALKKSESGSKQAKELASALGSQRAVADMHELRRVLQIADVIRGLKDALPPVIDDEVEEQFDRIRIAYDNVVENFPAGAPYVVLSLAPRVTHPWELFGIAGKLIQADDDQDLKHSELSMIGEWLVLDLENEARALKDLKVAGFDPQYADETLRRFAVLQAGMTREVGMRKDGQWGKRLLKARGAVSSGLESLFGGILQELRANLPMEKATSGAKSGKLVPILESPPEPDVIARLESILQFLATARLFAGQLGYSVAFEKTKNEAMSLMEEFGDGVIGILQTGKRKDKETALAWAEACQRLMTQIHAPDALKIFTRRIAAATADQQAKAQG